MFVFQSCCGVCSLRFGVILIAVLFGSIGLHQTYYNATVAIHDLRNPALLRSHELTAEHRWTLFHSGIATVVLLLNIALLLGAIFEKTWLLIPWLIVQTAATGVCSTLLFVYAFFVIFINFSIGLLVFAVSTIFAVFHVYTVMVVYSYLNVISGGKPQRYLSLYSA